MELANIWPALASAVSIFILGGVWYAPNVFGKVWMKEAGLPMSHDKKDHSPTVYVLSFLYSVLSALAFIYVVGDHSNLERALCMGLLIGLCFVAASFGINYLFANRSFKLFCIDGGYHVVQFILYGLIVGLWPY